MTDNEMIKALECCGLEYYCIECPLNRTQKCIPKMSENALSFINRQKAEIERLQKYNTDVAHKHYRDGIKEFAERLKEKRGTMCELWDRDIDNLVKEMTESER